MWTLLLALAGAAGWWNLLPVTNWRTTSIPSGACSMPHRLCCAFRIPWLVKAWPWVLRPAKVACAKSPRKAASHVSAAQRRRRSTWCSKLARSHFTTGRVSDGGLCPKRGGAGPRGPAPNALWVQGRSSWAGSRGRRPSWGHEATPRSRRFEVAPTKAPATSLAPEPGPDPSPEPAAGTGHDLQRRYAASSASFARTCSA